MKAGPCKVDSSQDQRYTKHYYNLCIIKMYHKIPAYRKWLNLCEIMECFISLTYASSIYVVRVRSHIVFIPD